MVKRLRCSNCKDELTTCDGGYGHKFKEGEKIFCKRMPKSSGCGKALHFCDEFEGKEAILDSLSENMPYRITTYGKEVIVIQDKNTTNKGA